MTPQKNLQKPLFYLRLGSFGNKKMFGDMVVRYMPNSGHGGPPGSPFMTIFVFYVSAQIPNIEYFEAYEVYTSREVSRLFSYQIPVECRQNHVWRPIFEPSYDHFYINVHFVTLELGDTHG